MLFKDSIDPSSGNKFCNILWFFFSIKYKLFILISENISDDKEIDDDKILTFEKELEAFSTMSKDEKLDFIMKDQDLSYDQAVMYLDYKMYKDEW